MIVSFEVFQVVIITTWNTTSNIENLKLKYF